MSKFTEKYPAQEKALWISRWQKSGKLRSEFAREHGLNYNNFKQWVLAHQKSASPSSTPDTTTPKPETPSSTPPFLAIKIDAEPSPGRPSMPVMEITFANGSHLSIYQPLPADYIRQLLK